MTARRPVHVDDAVGDLWGQFLQPDTVLRRPSRIDNTFAISSAEADTVIEAGAVAFFVPGIPAAQGNKQAFRNKYSGKVALVERTAGNPHWRQDVRDAFDKVRAVGQEPFSGPLAADLRFVFPRPKSHYNSRGELKPTAPHYKTSRPDVDKLQRALLDAIQVPTGGSAIADDDLVAQISATKEYGERPGCHVTVSRLA